tara:strand:+ start:76 stop:378 length:303 start_codon:yes stop_codon:yes gene_type:complete
MEFINNNDNAMPILSRLRVSELFSNNEHPKIERNTSIIVKPMSSIEHEECGQRYSCSLDIFDCSQLEFQPYKFQKTEMLQQVTSIPVKKEEELLDDSQSA